MGIALSVLLQLFVHFAHAANAQGTVQTQVVTTDDITPSLTPTDTPSVTPTVTPTDTVTPTPTGTPTVTPSVTPEGDGDKDDMLDIPASIKAFFGLQNAAARHERNEERFEEKHGVDVDANK